jgi:hypothetical protein
MPRVYGGSPHLIPPAVDAGLLNSGVRLAK